MHADQTRNQSVNKCNNSSILAAHDASVDADVNFRIGKASAMFQWLRISLSAPLSILRLNKKPRRTNSNLRQRNTWKIVVPIANYASETWKTIARTVPEHFVSHITIELPTKESCEEASSEVCKISWQNVECVLPVHVLRLPNQRHPEDCDAMDTTKTGTPCKTLCQTFTEDLQVLDIG